MSPVAAPTAMEMTDMVKPHFLDNYQVEDDIMGGGRVIKMMLRLTYFGQTAGGVLWNMGDVREVRCWAVVACHELIKKINTTYPGNMSVREESVDLRIYGVPVDATVLLEVVSVDPKA